MKLQYLGTAAAEGLPGLFCDCENCRRARKLGGRSIRSRSQAIVDGRLLIDFGPDTLWHLCRENIDLCEVPHCLITHIHQDHLLPEDLCFMHPGYSWPRKGYTFTVHGSRDLREKLAPMLETCKDCLLLDVLRPFSVSEIGGYTVTALPAVHDRPGRTPFIYLISDGEKTLLYGHDTDYFFPEVWQYLRQSGTHLDLVSLDCTNGAIPKADYIGHMGVNQDAEVRHRLLEEGIADDKTVFVLNHFSHNGLSVVYDDMVPLAAARGFLTSYDGMVVEV